MRPSRSLLAVAAFAIGCGTSGPPSAPGPSDAAARDATFGPPDAADDAPTDAGTDGGGACILATDGGAESAWVWVDGNGQLAYKALPKGERILDFSYAGYGGGGVALPQVPAARTVSPSGGGADDTPAIQAAIDAVSALPLANGFRGAVLLAPGAYTIAGTLSIAASGVVLRGSGSAGAHATTLTMTGAPRTLFTIAGAGSWQNAGPAATITDAYAPSGTRTFHVDDPSKLAVGQAVLVQRPVTQEWVHFMGMDTLVRNDAGETWIAPGSIIKADRVVEAIAGSEITVDAPLSDSFDATYVAPGATVVPYTFAGRIEQVGLEAMHVIAPAQTAPIDQPTFTALTMGAVANAWVKDVVAEEFTFGFVLQSTAKWVTIDGASVVRTAPVDTTSGLPFHYSIDGQLTLVLRSSSTGSNVFSYATMSRCPGPNAVLDFSASGTPTNVQPHERWATGLLLDNVRTPTGGIGLMDRGYYGSGHGWTVGFGVVWNGVADDLLIQQPPGATNWAIGSTGKVTTAAQPGSTDASPLPQGIIDSPGVPVAPRSLYVAQLCARRGAQALTNIGY